MRDRDLKMSGSDFGLCFEYLVSLAKAYFKFNTLHVYNTIRRKTKNKIKNKSSFFGGVVVSEQYPGHP